MPKSIGKIFSNRQLGMNIYTKLVMIMELEWKILLTSRSLRVRSTKFTSPNFHKCAWISSEGKDHEKIDHILKDSRRNSSDLISDLLGLQNLMLTNIGWWIKLGRN
jgi:hypothetical protein